MRILHHIRNLISDRQGVAAVEFALTAPFLILLALGGFEISHFLLVHQKADRIAFTVTDVTTQSPTVTRNQLDLILDSSAKIMEPLTFAGNGKIIISSIDKSGTNPPTIRWQYEGAGTLDRTSKVGLANQNATLPVPMPLADKENIIISEVFYRYEPILNIGLFDGRDIYKTVLFKPRLGALTTPPA